MDHVPPRTIEIPGTADPPVRADVYAPRGDCRGIVILCHGLKGYKTWGFLPYLAASLSQGGLAALSMDMSLNGTYPAAGCDAVGRRYVRPDLFERNTLSREYTDVCAVVRFVSEGGLQEEAGGASAIGLFGHSRGAVTCALAAIELPAVRALCTWALCADPDFYTSKQKERWRREGVYAFTDAEGTPLGIGIDYLNDLEENHDFYHIERRVAELKVPHLIVHGDADVVIDVASASAIHDAERHLEHKRLIVIRAGHTFGVPYPAPDSLADPPAALRVAADETVAWFETHLSDGGSQ